MRPSDVILGEISAEERRLAVLKTQLQDSESRLQTLRAELATVAVKPAIKIQTSFAAARGVTPQTSAEKVALFRSLFRGRSDVFPVRFVSKKTSKPGYAPACTNKFVRGVCELPKVKCGDCPNQALCCFCVAGFRL